MIEPPTVAVASHAGGSPGLRGTTEPLAALHDVALLDLDGVVYIGASAVEHAAESLDVAVTDFGMRAAFVTNNASRPPDLVASHLVSLGVPATPGDVVTSAQAGARLLRELGIPAGARVLAVGGPGVAEALRERGYVAVFQDSADVAAIIQGYGPDVGWRELAEASLALGRGAAWVATNLDRTIPSPRGRVLGNGSLVAALQHATGVTPAAAGKPEEPLMLESIERTGATRPLVVGDRLDTDIEGANRCDVPSLLVLTGVTDWHDLLGAGPILRPTYLGRDLRALLRPAPGVPVSVTGETVRAECHGVVLEVSVARRDSGTSLETGWLPGAFAERTDVRAISDEDLDAIRAIVATAWTMADAGLVPVARARVRQDHAH